MSRVSLGSVLKAAGLSAVAGVFAATSVTAARGSVPPAISSEASLHGGAAIFNGEMPAVGHITATFLKGEESYGGSETTSTVTFTLPKGVTASGVELGGGGDGDGDLNGPELASIDGNGDFTSCARPTAIVAKGNEVKFQIACAPGQGFVWNADVASRLAEGSYDVTAELKVDSTKRVKTPAPNMWQIRMPEAFEVPFQLSPLTVTPAQLQFGNAAIGDWTELPLTFTNNTAAELHMTDSWIHPAFHLNPDSAGNCETVEAGASCVLVIAFAPYSTGPVAGSLATTWSDSEGPLPERGTPLNGYGDPALLNASLTSLVFGPVEVNTTSPVQTVTFTNQSADVTLHVSGAPSYVGDKYFSADASDCSPGIAYEQSCDVTVTFTPTARGDFNGAMILTWAGPDNLPVTHSATMVDGTGAPLGFGMVNQMPDVVDYGFVAVGATSTAGEINFANNTSNTTLRLLNYTSLSSISVVSNDCNPTAGIGPGGTCMFSVAINPATLGFYDETIKFEWAAPNSNTVLAETYAQLTGNGYQAGMMSGPTELSFGQVTVNTTSTKTLTFVNTSTQNLYARGFSGWGSFQVSGEENCRPEGGIPKEVGTCTLSVSFTPTEAGTYVGGLQITWSAPDSEDVLTVSTTKLIGTGTP